MQYSILDGFTYATFKHSQALAMGDVWRMKVEGGSAAVGFAGLAYNPNKDEETEEHLAWLCLSSGTTGG